MVALCRSRLGATVFLDDVASFFHGSTDRDGVTPRSTERARLTGNGLQEGGQGKRKDL
jgi:hypothetical protein